MLLRNLSFCVILTLAATSFFASSLSAQTAQYELRFEARWVAPAPIPTNAHFTQLIGSTHNADGSIFSIGGQASQGVENVAETGSVNALVSEINSTIAAGDAADLILGTDTFIDPEEIDTFTFTADASRSQFSILTMIAPSPDWFVGVSNLDLLDGNGNWRDLIQLDLNSYDAGTENGSGFSLSNAATNPQSQIQLLDSAEPNGTLEGVGSIARLTLTRISTVPEPSSMILLIGGCLAGSARRRRQFSSRRN